MKKIYLFVLFQLLCAVSAFAQQELSVSAGKYSIGTPEQFVSQVLQLALDENYQSLEKLYSWSWRRFYEGFDERYPWKRIQEAESLDNIYILSVKKSRYHRDLYNISLRWKNAKKGNSHKTLLVSKEADTYKLAVQANGSLTGNELVGIGYKKDYAQKILNLLQLQKESGTDTTETYALDSKYSLRVSYGEKSGKVDSLIVFPKGAPGKYEINAYLIEFDAETNYTVKFISERPQ